MEVRRWERLGLQALASLPLWLAATLVAAFARDFSEAAAAIVAGAGLISLAGLLAILTLSRRVQRSGERERHIVAQSLALVDCMKDLHRRVAHIEAARKTDDQPEVALVMASQLGMPAADNDAPQDGCTVEGCESRDQAGEIVARRVVRLAEELPVAESEPAIAPVAICLDWRDGQVKTASELARLLAAAARQPPAAAVEIMMPIQLLPEPEVTRTMERALAGGGSCLVLRVDQAALRTVTREQAHVLTRLARQGLRLGLTGLSALHTAPEALVRCAVVHVHVERGRFLDAVRDNASAVQGWSAALARQGIRLVVDGVRDGRDAALLAALGASFGSMAGVEPGGAPSGFVQRHSLAVPPHAEVGRAAI